jgi:hypothetical protein
MEAIRGGNDRRKHRRLPVKVGAFCRKVSSLHDYAFIANTVNICPDGLLVESGQNFAADAGDLFNIELDMPDANGMDRVGGKVSAYARVVRIAQLQPQQNAGKNQIAFQFCTQPQFDI